MTNFGDMTQIEFSDALASSNPTPGGGSAAAVALSQSAALTLMVSELTIGRDKWSSGWGAAENAKDIASPLINHGFILADKDSEAFNQVMKSFKLPKDTEEQKKLRSEAIHNATLEASNKYEDALSMKRWERNLEILQAQLSLMKIRLSKNH